MVDHRKLVCNSEGTSSLASIPHLTGPMVATTGRAGGLEAWRITAVQKGRNSSDTSRVVQNNNRDIEM